MNIVSFYGHIHNNKHELISDQFKEEEKKGTSKEKLLCHSYLLFSFILFEK